MPPMQYWEVIAGKLSAAGWSWGYCSAVTEMGGAGSLTPIAEMGAATSFILTSCKAPSWSWKRRCCDRPTASNNTANGFNVLVSNQTGYHNSGSGVSALFANTTGHDNTAEGYRALLNNSTGFFNIAIGSNAGANLTTGTNNIDIDHPGATDDTKTIRIGTPGKQIAAFVAGIRRTTTANGNAVPVVIDLAGQLGTVSSSQRFKSDIQQMHITSEALLKLKPVTFHYNSDTQNTPQFGLIAEEVAKVNPNLVVRNENGEIYTVRYEAVNAMLLNEFLKEHRKVEEQQSTIDQLKAAVAKQQEAFRSKIAQQQKQIEALTTTVQKSASGSS
jgi:uncharacterized coiled-coil protein SlyX